MTGLKLVVVSASCRVIAINKDPSILKDHMVIVINKDPSILKGHMVIVINKNPSILKDHGN
jgi:hypothetical protein